MNRRGTSAPIRINGQLHPFRSCSVAGLLAELGCRDGPGVAVAVNDEVVPRSMWSERELAPGDRVEVVGAVQGG